MPVSPEIFYAGIIGGYGKAFFNQLLGAVGRHENIVFGKAHIHAADGDFFLDDSDQLTHNLAGIEALGYFRRKALKQAVLLFFPGKQGVDQLLQHDENSRDDHGEKNGDDRGYGRAAQVIMHIEEDAEWLDKIGGGKYA